MKLLASNVIAVGGGKGGVGKSFFASNIACALALRGQTTILVDADLAGANIHTLFGINYPEKTLSDYFKKKVESFSDVLLSTPLPNLKLICGASDLIEIANPKYGQKQKVINEITRLNADTVIIDIGAGANLNNLDFFNAADIGVIVTTPSPPSLQNAYSFLKLAVHRKILTAFLGTPDLKTEVSAALGDESYKTMKKLMEFIEHRDATLAEKVRTSLSESRYHLMVNMATAAEGSRVSQTLGSVAYQYLDVHLGFLGAIGFEVTVENSMRKMEPLLLSNEAAVSDLFMDMAAKLFASPTQLPSLSRSASGTATAPKIKSNSAVQTSLHDEAFYQGTKLHVQTEDFGIEKAQILTLVFSGGEILFARKTEYHDVLNNTDLQHAVAERLKGQHLAVLADIRSGALERELSKK